MYMKEKRERDRERETERQTDRQKGVISQFEQLEMAPIWLAKCSVRAQESCAPVEVAILGSLSLISLMVYVDVTKQKVLQKLDDPAA